MEQEQPEDIFGWAHKGMDQRPPPAISPFSLAVHSHCNASTGYNLRRRCHRDGSGVLREDLCTPDLRLALRCSDTFVWGQLLFTHGSDAGTYRGGSLTVRRFWHIAGTANPRYTPTRSVPGAGNRAQCSGLQMYFGRNVYEVVQCLWKCGGLEHRGHRGRWCAGCDTKRGVGTVRGS
uniref:Uncharacterized protein n=1 Tax=Eutreptiella gymnastica TaxID=73025 RepID=A0A7S4LB61_9EUGL